MRKPSVNTNPVAGRYALTGERIVEVSSNVGGCLISLREREGQLHMAVYRADPTVVVLVPQDQEVHRGKG